MPVTLSNVSATAGDQSILFTWQISGSPAAGSYQFRYNLVGDATVLTTNVSATSPSISYNAGTSTYSYSLTGLTNGTAYNASFRVYSSVTPSVFSVIANSSVFTVTPAAPSGGGAPCFPAGVRIRTPSGEKPVETLRTGDLILTATGHAVPIRMHSYEIACATKANAPYYIPAGALGPKAPAKPLHLSPLHAFQIRPNVWWNAQEASKISTKLEQYGLGEPLTYYHVECPNFLRDNLVADGVVVESFAANQLTKDEKHHLYKYSQRLGGFVRNGAAVKRLTL